MPWNKQVTADTVVTRMIENQGLYNLCNRSFDRLVQPGATSVLVPKLPILLRKKNTGTTPTHADRKETKNDTTMVQVDLDVHAVPIGAQVAGEFESGGLLTTEFINSAVMTLSEGYDSDIIEAAQDTTNVLETVGGSLAWKDIVKINKSFNTNKVPKNGRVIVVSAELEEEFWEIEIFQKAAAYHKEVLQTGTFVSVMNNKFFISGLVPKIGGKDCVVGFYGPGIAAVLSRAAEIKEAYDPENLSTSIDLLSHFGAKLLSDEFSVVVKKK